MPKSLLTLVIAVTLVLVSMTATFAAQNVLKSRNSITVVDAKGVKVGDLFGGSSGVELIAFEVDQRPFVLRVSPQGLAGTSGGVVFQSSNCSGPPFILRVDDVSQILTLLPESAVDAPGHTLYLQDPDAEPLVLATFSGSQLFQDGTCGPALRGDTVTLIPVQPMVVSQIFSEAIVRPVEVGVRRPGRRTVRLG